MRTDFRFYSNIFDHFSMCCSSSVSQKLSKIHRTSLRSFYYSNYINGRDLRKTFKGNLNWKDKRHCNKDENSRYISNVHIIFCGNDLNFYYF